ncbi:MAG: hypothetical protein JST80_12865 [Bdellovibrionales bacterium]|nr:hypothetical protein [Bdellovibrionales bacterium]
MKMIMMILAGLVSQPSFARDLKPDSFLRFQYQLECDSKDQKSFPGIIAEIKIGTRKIRAYLVRYVNEQTVTLGAPTSDQISKMQIRYFPNPACTFKNVASNVIQNALSMSEEQELALAHSPYLILRPDQGSHPDRDVPLQLVYSIMRDSFGFSIRYTVYFSNETDYGLFAVKKTRSQALWGRRTDIEWIYQVDFDAAGKVVGRKCQSGVIFGIGHATKNFKGKFLTATQHPVLYDIARHNVFFDKPYPGQKFSSAGVHLTPFEEIKEPDAREEWMWRNPWSFDVSDRELRRTGHLNFSSDQYLYVKLRGSLNGGRVSVTGSALSGTQTITLAKLGEDLWGQEDYVAVRPQKFPEDGKTAGATINITPLQDKVTIDSVKFFRLVPTSAGFESREITGLFSCKSGSCRY